MPQHGLCQQKVRHFLDPSILRILFSYMLGLSVNNSYTLYQDFRIKAVCVLDIFKLELNQYKKSVQQSRGKKTENFLLHDMLN